MLVDVLGGEAEFFVKDFVRRREAEGVESPDGTVFSDESFECARQSGGHTETLDALREDGVLVFLGLLTEASFGRNADDLQADAIFAEQFSTGD